MERVLGAEQHFVPRWSAACLPARPTGPTWPRGDAEPTVSSAVWWDQDLRRGEAPRPSPGPHETTAQITEHSCALRHSSLDPCPSRTQKGYKYTLYSIQIRRAQEIFMHCIHCTVLWIPALTTAKTIINITNITPLPGRKKFPVRM